MQSVIKMTMQYNPNEHAKYVSIFSKPIFPSGIEEWAKGEYRIPQKRKKDFFFLLPLLINK